METLAAVVKRIALEQSTDDAQVFYNDTGALILTPDHIIEVYRPSLGWFADFTSHDGSTHGWKEYPI